MNIKVFQARALDFLPDTINLHYATNCLMKSG